MTLDTLTYVQLAFGDPTNDVYFLQPLTVAYPHLGARKPRKEPIIQEVSKARTCEAGVQTDRKKLPRASTDPFPSWLRSDRDTDYDILASTAPKPKISEVSDAPRNSEGSSARRTVKPSRRTVVIQEAVLGQGADPMRRSTRRTSIEGKKRSTLGWRLDEGERREVLRELRMDRNRQTRIIDDNDLPTGGELSPPLSSRKSKSDRRPRLSVEKLEQGGMVDLTQMMNKMEASSNSKTADKNQIFSDLDRNLLGLAAAEENVVAPTSSLKTKTLTKEELNVLKYCFQSFDFDGDMCVNCHELKSLFRALHLHVSLAVCIEFIAKYDDNNTGRLEMDEFINLMSTLLKTPQPEDEKKISFETSH